MCVIDTLNPFLAALQPPPWTPLPWQPSNPPPHPEPPLPWQPSNPHPEPPPFPGTPPMPQPPLWTPLPCTPPTPQPHHIPLLLAPLQHPPWPTPSLVPLQPPNPTVNPPFPGTPPTPTVTLLWRRRRRSRRRRRRRRRDWPFQQHAARWAGQTPEGRPSCDSPPDSSPRRWAGRCGSWSLRTRTRNRGTECCAPGKKAPQELW